MNSSRSPARTAPTNDFTGFCRCEVPSNDDPEAARAASACGRIFDGPAPKRPSDGRIDAGIVIVGLT